MYASGAGVAAMRVQSRWESSWCRPAEAEMALPWLSLLRILVLSASG